MWSRTTLLLGIVLAGCGEPADTATTNSPSNPEFTRWYNSSQVEQGRQVFMTHCASCHGQSAEGLAEDWRQRLPDGSFPPPPLNGTAHAWHHPLSVLLQVINEGGVPLGGRMPAFATTLSDAEKLSAVAYFQQFWTDDIYQAWLQMGGTN